MITFTEEMNVSQEHVKSQIEANFMHEKADRKLGVELVNSGQKNVLESTNWR